MTFVLGPRAGSGEQQHDVTVAGPQRSDHRGVHRRQHAASTAGRTDHHDVTAFVPVATGAGARERSDACRERWGLEGDVARRGVAGDAEQVAEGLHARVEAGADAVALQPTDDEPDPEAFMAFAGEMAPLLRRGRRTGPDGWAS